MTTKDLFKGVSYIEKDDYFLVTIEDLNPDTVYPFQFKWKFKDGTTGPDWSAVYRVTTQEEQSSDLPIPSFSSLDVDTFPGTLIISWNGKDSSLRDIKGIDRVSVFITDQNNTFGDGTKESAFFKSAGRISLAAPAGTYTIRLASVSPSGLIGTKSSSVTVTIEDGIVIDDPLVAVGLSVTPAPFAITASWGGKYENDETFGGLKSINIYASETDLGLTTTSVSSPSLKDNLVGTMTVNDTINKVTIGMSVLKQVLSIGSPAHSPTSEELYALPVFFYHVAVNDNGKPYMVDGNILYTRINSSGVSPTKANFIDLAAGTISIENLVAGNGQFQDWLRVGEPGGSRIELSANAVNPEEAGGYSVLQGLTVWKQGSSTPAFRADLAGNVAIGRFTANDIATIETAADDAATAAATADGKAVSASSAASSASSAAAAAAETARLANEAAYNAQQKATEAYNKVAHFNADGSKVTLGIEMDASGSIYSNKDSYANTNTGWFLGNLISGSSFTPVINIGSADKFLKWNGSELDIQGKLTATSGAIVGDFTVGNVVFKPTGNNGFLIEDSDGNDVLYTPTSGGRITLGHSVEGTGRQVEVARSAQIAGDSQGAGATNSGGLRNMYTATVNNFATYPDAYLTHRLYSNGDVLLVWDPNS